MTASTTRRRPMKWTGPHTTQALRTRAWTFWTSAVASVDSQVRPMQRLKSSLWIMAITFILLIAVKLAELFPDKLTLALEIRAKVTEYVRLRIEALRSENPGQFQNVSALRTNAMRYLPHYFRKGQITKMFFCFPDPQFKARLHRRRIVHTPLLAEYAYLLAPGGILYTITDVEELHQWHVEKCSSHPCFTRIPDSELESDPCVKAMTEETEEGKKVARGGGKKYVAVFRRKANEDVAVDNLFW
ncbi:tRNA (guanine-N(7)-)-methyltransferase, variant 1 [Phytophthora nicotianae CJ01A1]|uniref:tRNA (guanine-N(7)-)-methyltransferase n=12 Tax=Phytophthora nicotianae TaxID=4792 RepID=W2RHS9_PHYN3|nr:tRNA (guanine-N(7)-)-methyltransferase, variant 1 [Phytophthora nicotianae INRA-310]ETI56296.1 tRNA (guanine-N(7)-)-methyltransferase, variant 1 [Phytophthora nicotianae P1569]ETK96086.1 tRNA (guanine-N(7)-)-methyltransferase, variant 1 [Phytophthora nicotianae]ETO85040.1 tRNA (guanine-N(7)-)-methyltransferase, variant 1 [Phytophthora nicotianae P1976]ETP26098.1 tRNA (guanine-N(7)-)-methyltransferase, variant 1 [Phytophthora nicotianae CJ01A1]ETP54089.1 tRNA (guanine-N(7)-)-methyltransferas